MRLHHSALLAAALVFGCSASNDDGGKAPSDSGTREASAPEASVDASVEAGHRDASTALDGATDAHDAALPPGSYPQHLSETGLFSDMKKETLAPGVREYEPKYKLWSDGAVKRRWVSLPAGAQIDTSDMDYWKYPVGTKAWKEFTRDGVRVETRMLHKAGPNKEDWVMIAYQWRSDMSDADAVPNGVPNASRTQHDIPDQNTCAFCHGNMKDTLLGITALQLSHDLPGLKITDLISEGSLSAPPAAPFSLPGSALAQSALGYLHANCGHCHNPKSQVAVTVSLRLWESTGALSSVETTVGYESTVGQRNDALPQFHIIEPGRPSQSELVVRISHRGDQLQMPPAGTELVDVEGVKTITEWISSLPKAPDAGVPDAGAPDGSASDAGPRDAATGG
jgi:hypothetical protein